MTAGKIVLNCMIHSSALDAAATGNIWGIAQVGIYLALLATSILGGAVIIERFVRLRRRRLVDEDLYATLPDLIAGGNLTDSIRRCEQSPSILGAALTRELKDYQAGQIDLPEAAESAGEIVGRKTIANFDLLKTVATVAPLFGLLGTILGMMFAFSQVDLVARKETLALGIVTALDTTVRGLVIAIVCIAFERHLMRKIDNALVEISAALTKIIRVGQKLKSATQRG